MPTKDRRTEAELLAALDDRNEKIVQLTEMLQDKGQEYRETISKTRSELLSADIARTEKEKALHRTALKSVKAVNYLGGKADGILMALGLVLGMKDLKSAHAEYTAGIEEFIGDLDDEDFGIEPDLME